MELIPKGFVDIHSHILPGIDDGAQNIEESIKLIAEMKKLGFSKIIGTPHSYPGLYDNTIDSIKNAYNQVKGLVPDNIEIGFASEYMLDKDIIKMVKGNKILCLKDNYVLIEMSYLSAPANLYELIFEIKVNGYNPILAHPERYIYLHNNFDEYLKLKKVGCYFQINLLSATDYYGKNVTKILEKLLKYKLINFAGSDIHRIKHISYFDKKTSLNMIEEFERVLENNLFFKN